MAFESSVHKYPDILYKYGKRFRYYPVDEYDINDFIDRLNLTKYQNKEISTKKSCLIVLSSWRSLIFVMKYELHNLLKKTEKEMEYRRKTTDIPPKNAFEFFWTCR